MGKSGIKKNIISIIIFLLICINVSACNHQQPTQMPEIDSTAVNYYSDDKSYFDIVNYINANGFVIYVDNESVTAQIDDWGILIDISTEPSDLSNCMITILYGNDIQGFHVSCSLDASCKINTDKVEAVCVNDDDNGKIYFDAELLEDFTRIVPILLQKSAGSECPLCGSGIKHKHSDVIKY